MIKKTKKTRVKQVKVVQNEKIEAIIGGLVETLKKKGIDIESIVPNCGNPNCPVHGNLNQASKFIPSTKEQVDKAQKTVYDVMVNGASGFIYIGKSIDTKLPNEPKNSVGGMVGTLKVNRISSVHILLSLINQLGLTEEEAVNAITDPAYGVENGDLKDFPNL